MDGMLRQRKKNDFTNISRMENNVFLPVKKPIKQKYRNWTPSKVSMQNKTEAHISC